MQMTILIVVSILLSGAVIALLLLLHQAQQLKMSEVLLRERLLSRDSELTALQQQSSRMLTDNSALNLDIQQYREDNASLKTSLQLERKQFEDKLAFLDESKQQLAITFKNIANEIFEDKSKTLTANNKESLATVLNPLQEKIVQFEKRVEETYDKESKERFSLAKEIQNLQELNSKISVDAINLTNALKGDNKAQGSPAIVLYTKVQCFFYQRQCFG